MQGESSSKLSVLEATGSITSADATAAECALEAAHPCTDVIGCEMCLCGLAAGVTNNGEGASAVSESAGYA